MTQLQPSRCEALCALGETGGAVALAVEKLRDADPTYRLEMRAAAAACRLGDFVAAKPKKQPAPPPPPPPPPPPCVPPHHSNGRRASAAAVAAAAAALVRPGDDGAPPPQQQQLGGGGGDAFSTNGVVESYPTVLLGPSTRTNAELYATP